MRIDGTRDPDVIDGTQDADFIFARHGSDEIYGWAGNDTIHGGVGNDLISGGFGVDVMSGGQGSDLFLVFPELASDDPTKADRIRDFEAGAGGDMLEITGALNVRAVQLVHGTLIEGETVAGWQKVVYLAGVNAVDLTEDNFAGGNLPDIIA